MGIFLYLNKYKIISEKLLLPFSMKIVMSIVQGLNLTLHRHFEIFADLIKFPQCKWTKFLVRFWGKRNVLIYKIGHKIMGHGTYGGPF